MSGIRRRHSTRPSAHRKTVPAAAGAIALALSAVAGVSAAAASPSAAPTDAATFVEATHPAAVLADLNQARLADVISRGTSRVSIGAGRAAKDEATAERSARATAQIADAIATERAAEKVARAKARKAAAAKKAAQKAAAQLAANQADPQGVARRVMGEYGFGADQFGCLVQLWTGESDWNYTASNPSSGAYGIPQALPATKMATAGADWQTNPETQIRWGLGYIKASYGTPCGALNFWNSHYPHWY